VPLSTALATRFPAALASPAQFGSGTAMQTLAGSVSAFFALESFDRRRGVATYLLRVVNRTHSTLICRTWVISRSGDAALAYPVLLEVEPLSTSAMQVPVWPRDFASFDRAIAEIAGEGVQCIVEAPAPPRFNSEQLYTRLAAASLAVGVVALTLAAVLNGALPRIAAFAVPPEALAGTTVRAEYQASGAGTLSYSVLAPNGRKIQGGSLGDHSGSLPIPLPQSGSSGAYTLQMTMAGALGSVSETRVLNTIVGNGAHDAEIGGISVAPLVAKPGQVVNVAYSASGDQGYVRLMSDDGTIWQQQPFSRGGQTQLVVPPVTVSQQMKILLHVTKGRSAAQSVAGLLVVPAAASRTLNAAPQIVSDDDPGTGSTGAPDSGANGTFALASPTVKSGATIHIQVLSPRNGMRIAVTDAQSREVSGLNVGSDSTEVTLTAPTVTVPTRYTVVASFTDGFGQESVVEPLTVVP
jgi:hypothetical protein